MKKNRKKQISRKIEEILIENFVGLQKVMTNLSIKFELLSDNISKLLEILELSAKNYLEKEKVVGENDLEKRINFLIEQNKAIAEGLLLIDDALRKKELEKNQNRQIFSKPLPQKI